MKAMEQSPSKKLKKFFATSRPNFYKKGEIVLRIGDSRSGAFFVNKGYIKDSSISPDGREFTLFIFKPGDLFSYRWIFNKVQNEHSFRAMTDCVIYEKTREGLLLFLEENPDVQLMITQNIVIRMHGLMQRMEHLAFGTASQKVASILTILAERFGKAEEKDYKILIPLTQQDISELIGLSRETTSIEIKKLMDEKLLTRSSRSYLIKDLRRLKRKASIFI